MLAPQTSITGHVENQKPEVIIYLPILCFLSVAKAVSAAIVWMKMDEKNAHRKMWYHISMQIQTNKINSTSLYPYWFNQTN